MRLSLYTFVRNGLYLDFHVIPMLRHHLPLADEIVVLEGYSTDGTYEAIRDLDPKIKVHRSEWGAQNSMDWYVRFKNQARELCTGDWCLYLDCDEFLPEWDFTRLRTRLEHASETLLPIDVINFYGSYRVYHTRPAAAHWPHRKVAIHRNRSDVRFWGDGSNVGVVGEEYIWPAAEPYEFCCHHFGYVRHAARLREKWRAQNSMYTGKALFRIPGFVFNWLPHRWDDPAFMADLAIWDGPHIQPVRDDPDEFIRDGLKTYRLLEKRARSEQV
jgi:glycosyltransferase involved in cell wall biosynthesis